MKNKSHPTALVIKRVLRASRERVFDAWTDPRQMERWLMPKGWSAESSNELRVGGGYSQNMITNGIGSACDPEGAGSPGDSHLHTGVYLEIVKPERLVFTWTSSLVKDSRVTVELKEVAGGTELTLTHELLETEEIKGRHSDGWGSCLANLEDFMGWRK